VLSLLLVRSVNPALLWLLCSPNLMQGLAPVRLTYGVIGGVDYKRLSYDDLMLGPFNGRTFFVGSLHRDTLITMFAVGRYL
jgi:hypothetical protein